VSDRFDDSAAYDTAHRRRLPPPRRVAIVSAGVPAGRAAASGG